MVQSSSTLFMGTRDGHQRRVSFDMKEELGDKKDKLAVMIGKLATRDSRTNNNSNHKYSRAEVEVKTENYSYDQRNHQDRYRPNQQVK